MIIISKLNGGLLFERRRSLSGGRSSTEPAWNIVQRASPRVGCRYLRTRATRSAISGNLALATPSSWRDVDDLTYAFYIPVCPPLPRKQRANRHLRFPGLLVEWERGGATPE